MLEILRKSSSSRGTMLTVTGVSWAGLEDRSLQNETIYHYNYEPGLGKGHGEAVGVDGGGSPGGRGRANPMEPHDLGRRWRAPAPLCAITTHERQNE
jgi:hypothetical protein